MQGIKDILANHILPQAKEEYGEPSSSDTSTFTCAICQDRGIVIEGSSARPCQCMQQKELFNKFKYARISASMMKQTFASFNLDYYSHCLADSEKNRSYYETAQRALQGAREFVDNYVKNPNTLGVMFTGQVGSGKTFLACAIANALMERDKNLLFLVVPDLLDELRATYGRKDNSENSEQDLLDAARTVPVLILDDLGAHNYTDWTKNRIYTIINHRMNYQLPTIITTNLDIHELGEHLGDRTSSRILQMCRVYKIFIERDVRLVNYLERENKK